MSSLLFTLIGIIGVAVTLIVYVIAVLRFAKRERLTNEQIQDYLRRLEIAKPKDQKEDRTNKQF